MKNSYKALVCQTTLDIILVHDYSLDGACYNDGNEVECKCGDMYIHQNYIYRYEFQVEF